MAESSEASDNMSPSIIRRKSDPYSNWEAFRDSKIEISVGNPVMKEEFLTKYFVYKIQGTDLKGYFEVSRRYSDFEKIRQMLVMRWPGCFVPSLPVKQINNMGKGVVEDRKKHLDHFCKSMASIPHLHYSEVYQIFLRSKMGDIDPLLQTHQKIKYDDMVFRYTKVFAHLSGREINTDAQFKITSFGQFLQKSASQFEKFKKIAKKYVVARKEFAAQFGEMHGMMANEYEKNIFSEYNNKDQQKHVFFNPTSNQNSDVEKVKAYESREAPDKLYEWIKNEGRDIEAFYEAFTQRDKYTELKNKTEKNSKADSKELQNQAAGKKTLKSLFTSGKKEENIAKLEDKINETGKDLENLILIQDLVTIVMAYEEIDKFKRIRVEKYFKLIGETAESEIDTFSAILDYWRTMLENPNVGQAMKS